MPHILIVEDDNNINNLLSEALGKYGYTCEQAFSGTEAALLIRMNSYDLVLLDLMLPGMSGEEVLKTIRSKSSIPVIVVTAKDSIDDKIDVLVNGADDCISKPFNIKEVIARIGVQLRHNTSAQETGSSQITHKGITLDMMNYTVTAEGHVLPKITKQEFSILELLVRNPKKVFTKEEMFEYAWNEPYMGETKTLDVHISNIRRKLKAVSDTEYIETVWGIGYKLY